MNCSYMYMYVRVPLRGGGGGGGEEGYCNRVYLPLPFSQNVLASCALIWFPIAFPKALTFGSLIPAKCKTCDQRYSPILTSEGSKIGRIYIVARERL